MTIIFKNYKTRQKLCKSLTLLIIFITTIVSCNKDNDNNIVQKKEVLTLKVVLINTTDATDVITLLATDSDGNGPIQPTVSVSNGFDDFKTYNGKITLINETTNPPLNITDKIENSAQEKLEHQFFFEKISGLTGVFSYSDQDSAANPVGINFIYACGGAVEGNLKLTLRNKLNKSGVNVSLGNITNAGGTTVMEVTFPLRIID